MRDPQIQSTSDTARSSFVFLQHNVDTHSKRINLTDVGVRDGKGLERRAINYHTTDSFVSTNLKLNLPHPSNVSLKNFISFLLEEKLWLGQ